MLRRHQVPQAGKACFSFIDCFAVSSGFDGFGSFAGSAGFGVARGIKSPLRLRGATRVRGARPLRVGGAEAHTRHVIRLRDTRTCRRVTRALYTACIPARVYV